MDSQQLPKAAYHRPRPALLEFNCFGQDVNRLGYVPASVDEHRQAVGRVGIRGIQGQDPLEKCLRQRVVANSTGVQGVPGEYEDVVGAVDEAGLVGFNR